MAATVKGIYPIQEDFFSALYAQFVEKNNGSSFCDELMKAVSTHFNGSPLAIFVAAFNAVTFLGAEVGAAALGHVDQLDSSGSSFLEMVLRAAKPSGGNIFLLQDLIVAHAYLGLGVMWKFLKENGGGRSSCVAA